MKKFYKDNNKNQQNFKIITVTLAETYLLEDKIRCPNPDCEGINYLSYNEIYDEEWISLQCECLNCHTRFQINYRAVGIDVIHWNKKF